MFRVSSSAPDRGPLRPIPRAATARTDREGWSRFDVGADPLSGLPGLTIYGATRRDTAFTEALAWKAATSATYAGLLEEAQFTGTSIDALLDELHRSGVRVGGVDIAWRKSRLIYTLQTPRAVWVDLFHRGSVSAIRGLIGAGMGSDPLTISTITGDDRSLTTHIAETLRGVTLEDPDGKARQPNGLRYPSKFGMAADDDFCWALWLKSSGSGADIESSEAMDPTDPDVITARRSLGIHVA